MLLILVHELGHFIFAKLFKVRVDEFGIGYPPKAIRIAKIGETEYTLNWLPFGGFVRLYGEDREDEKLSPEQKKRSLSHKEPWKQILILLAGALFNFLLGWFLFAAVYYSGAPLFWDKNYVENSTLMIAGTKVGSPAQVAGLSIGDTISEVYLKDKKDEKPALLSPDTVAEFIAKHPGESIEFKILKKTGQTEVVELNPAQGIIEDDPSRAAVGISMTLVSTERFGIFKSLYLGLKSSINVTKDVLQGLASLLKGAFSMSLDLKHVAGPVGIASMVGEAAQVGMAYLAYFMALISINLAVINLLPIPALDGGRIVFVIYEWIFRRKAPAWLENSVNFIGFGLLILLMLAITYNDILRLIYR